MYMHYNHCHWVTAPLQLNILLLLLLLVVVVVVVVVVLYVPPGFMSKPLHSVHRIYMLCVPLDYQHSMRHAHN